MVVLYVIFQVLLAIASLLLIVLILMHKGSGGGLSDMFGGGFTSSMSSSGVAQRNLNRITFVVTVLWAVFVIALTLMGKWIY